MATENNEVEVNEEVDGVESDEYSDSGDEGESSFLSFDEWKAAQGKGESDEEDDSEEEPEESDEEENSDEEVGEADAEPEPEPEVEPEPLTIKYKVDGEEKEIDLEKASLMLSKAEGADRRFQEAANLRKESIEFIEFFKANPIEALQRANIDFEQLAIDHVHELIRYEQMSDAEKKAYDTSKENEKLKKDMERERETRKEIEERQRHESLKMNLSNQIRTAVYSSSILPKDDPHSEERVALYMKDAITKGYDVTPEQVIKFVERDYKEYLKQEEAAERKQRMAAKPKTNPKKKAGSSKKSKTPRRVSSITDLLDL